MGACWHNLANTTESSVCFGDAAFLSNYFDHLFIMAALRSRCGHYIFALWFLSFYLFFLALSQRPQIGCLPYFDTWCGLSANLNQANLAKCNLHMHHINTTVCILKNKTVKRPSYMNHLQVEYIFYSKTR